MAPITHRHDNVSPAFFPHSRIGVVDESVEQDVVIDHAAGFQGLDHAAPAPGIHVPDLDQIREDQRARCSGFELKVIARLRNTILVEQQSDHLIRMVHRVTPPAQAGFAEGFDPVGIVIDFALRDSG